MDHPLDAHVFLKTIRPSLEKADAGQLARDVARHWQPIEICRLLQDQNTEVRRAAVLVLGLTGDCQVIPALARALHDFDEQVNHLAEDSMWSIWFRGGNAAAAASFDQGVTLLGQEKYCQALKLLEQAHELDPRFIEVSNQQAIAYFFLGQWEQSLACCTKVIRHVPAHFGAMSGQGHCHLQLGERQLALDNYKKALLINPRMPMIYDAVGRLEKQLHDSNDSSGIFPAQKLGV